MNATSEFTQDAKSGILAIEICRAGLNIPLDASEAAIARYGLDWYHGQTQRIAKRSSYINELSDTLRAMLAERGIELYVSGTFDWGVLPSDGGRTTLPELVNWIAENNGCLPRQRAEQASEMLAAGQRDSDAD